MILLIILLYFVLLSLYSRMVTGRNSTNETFFRGNRRSPWYMVAFGMIGASVSGITFVSVPGMVIRSDMTYLQTCLGFIFGYIAVAFVLLPIYYRLNLTTIYSYLKDRLGQRAYKTGAGFFLLSKLTGAAARFYVVCIMLQAFVFDELGIPFFLTVTGMVALIWVYTRSGGIKTLVWTDTLQTVCMFAALGLIIYNVAGRLDMSVTQAFTAVWNDSHSRVFEFSDFVSRQNFWKQFLSGIFIVIVMTGLDQDMMQKNLSCRNLSESRRNVLSYGAAFIPVNLLFLSLGVLLYRFAAERGVAVAKPDDLFPAIACGTDPLTGLSYMPTATGLLFVLGLVSAAFSSAGSALTALTTSFTVDILRADRKYGEERLKKVRSRVHVAGAVVMGLVIISFRLIGNGSVINAVYTVASYTYGPLLGLFAFGLLVRRKVRDRLVPAVCVASPLICLLLSTHSEAWFGGYRIGFELLLINALLTMAGLLAASRKTRPDACKYG